MAEEFILIVDDEDLIRKQAEIALRRAGYRTTTAGDAQEALNALKMMQVDLLLSDIRMPDVDGLQLYASARKLKPDLVCVLMTAHGSIDTAIKAMQLGVQGFLQKPFTGTELERAVQDALQKQRVSQEAIRSRILSPLFEARKLLVSEMNLTEFTRSIVEVVARETASDYCAIFLPDTHTSGVSRALRLEASYIEPNAKSFSPRHFPASRLAMRSLELGRTISMKRSGTDKLQSDSDNVPGVVMAVPLILQGNGLGAMLVGRVQAEKVFTPSEREMFEIIAAQLTTIVENRRLYLALREREERMRMFIGRFVSAQEEERKQLANRLNNEFLPTLSAARLNVQNFIEKVRPNSHELLQSEQSIKEALNQARHLTHDLRPPALDEFGLTAAVRQYVREFNEAFETNCKPSFRLEGTEAPRLDPAVETALFRATQEAVNNACKHAGGSAVEVTVKVISIKGKPQRLSVEVRDWGKGFDLDALQNSNPTLQIGLLAMQERVALVGGKCTIESTPGRGTLVTISCDVEV
jgi:two-component system, NarL family, sensor histidine kinase NreB